MSASKSSLLSDYFFNVRALLVANFEQQAKLEQQVKQNEAALNTAGISAVYQVQVAEAAAEGRGFPF